MANPRQQPTFLYPKSTRYPFDEVCGKIVRALEARNWSVPDVTVEFDVYGTGDAKCRMVRKVATNDCVVYFCREQGPLPSGLNDIAAVTQINIPRREIHVYADESGPTYYTYVGNDWERDKASFIQGSKVNSKLRGEPRTYLAYKGACRCEGRSSHYHNGRRSPILVHSNDLGREYEPNQGEPHQFVTAEVFDDFRLWLEQYLLAQIESYPVDTEARDIHTETAIPFPDNLPPIFCFGEYLDATRITTGRRDADDLQPKDRYGLPGNGYRLASLGVRGEFPQVAYDGFEWCAFGEVDETTPIESLTVPGHYRWSDRENHVLRISPSRANGVFVADNAALERRRRELFTEIAPREHLTDEELNQAIAARAATIIPIVAYDGSFEEPIVLINRELDLDEVEVVSGPWPKRR